MNMGQSGAGPSHQTAAATVDIKVAIRWHQNPDLAYLIRQEEMAAGNEVIGNGRFQIFLFPTNSKKDIFGKTASARVIQPIVVTTSHYDVATVTKVPQRWLDIVKGNRVAEEKTKMNNGKYDGLAVEIRMQMLAEEKTAPWGTLKWDEAQV
jgi:hypothetical protein